MYPQAAAFAVRVGATRIVDVGCGSGKKLSQLRRRFPHDRHRYGSNLEACRERYPESEWLAHDLDSDERLRGETAGAVLICSDVIKHVVRPDNLLRKLRAAVARAHAIVLSMPDRNLRWGLATTDHPQ